MKLTDTEKQRVRKGEVVEFQEDNLECVVLRRDLFERFRGLLGEPLPPDVVTTLVNQNMSEYDESDPLLQSYQTYKQ